MNRHEVGVIDRGRQTSLVDESATVLLVFRILGCDQLEGDLPVEARVPSPVDDPHPTLAELCPRSPILRTHHRARVSGRAESSQTRPRATSIRATMLV